MDRPPARSLRLRGGAVLLEALLSVALFVGAAGLALAAVRSAFTAMDRGQRELNAIDIARSKLAELEAGSISLADLRSRPVIEIGSREVAVGDVGETAPYMVAIKTSPTEFPGLTLVELTVSEAAGSDGFEVVERAPLFTLRQLVRLRDADIDESRDAERIEPPSTISGAELGEMQP